MKLTTTWLIIKKEILDTVRDSRTLTGMVIVPLVVYPLMFILLGYVSGREKLREQTIVPTIGIKQLALSSYLTECIEQCEYLNFVYIKTSGQDVLGNGSVDAVLEFPDNFLDLVMMDESPIIKLKIFYDAANRKSQLAKDKLLEFLDEFKHQIITSKLKTRNISPTVLNTFEVHTENIAPPAKMGGFVLGTIVPFILILLIYGGAIHTAVDITAGEKERKTIETLLVTKTTRNDIVIGKTLTVFVVSLFTGLMGLTGFMITFYSGFSVLTVSTDVELSISPASIIFMFIILIPSAWLFSSLLMCIGSLAKTQREGNNYATYSMFVVLSIGLIALTRGIDPTQFSRLSFIPIVNTIYIQRMLLIGNFDWLQILLTISINLLLGLLPFLLTVVLFSNTEKLLGR